MKKLLMTVTLLFGFILFTMPAYVESTGAVDSPEASKMEIESDATRACPNCSGNAPVIRDVIFQTGSTCSCSGTISLTIGPNVTVEPNATVSFRSPQINIKSGTDFKPGSVVTMCWINEPISIDLTAAPTSIPADGSSYSIITGVFRDGNGNLVPKGTSLTFTTTLGAFTTNSAQTYTIKTYDDTGTVAIFLYSGTTAGTATVTATLGGTTEDVPVTIYSRVTAGIVLQADPDVLDADGVSTSTVRASVTDATGSPVTDGTSIAFSMISGKGSLSAASAVTAGGIATVTYTASTTAGTETVKAEASNGVTDTFDITLTGTPGPANFALSTNQTAVKSDNSESAIITATVVDGNNASYPGATVSFSSDGGQLSVSSAVTDDKGQASITLSSGSINRSNRIITITATIANLGSRTIPVQVVGSTLSKITDKTTITDDNTTVAELTVTAKDAGGVAVFNAEIQFSFGLDDTGTATITPVNPVTYPYTDVSGQLKVIVTGVRAGSVTVIAGALGATATQAYTVSAVGTEFGVVIPSSDPFSASIRNPATLATTPNNISIAFVDGNPDTITRSDGNSFTVDGYLAGDTIMVGGSTDNDGVYTVQTVSNTTLTLINTDTLTAEGAGETVTITNGVLVRVRAFDQTQVSFSTTIGAWDDSVSAVAVKAVPASGYVWSVLTADTAGSATIQVYDTGNTTISDGATVVFSAPSADAAKLNLQANTYVLAPSTGDIQNMAVLTATVRSALGQVVGKAPVVFSIKNTTGGGETVSPVVVLTDSSGVAKTTFTSGSLSTGAEGVEITATVLNEGQTVDNTSIDFSDNYPAPCVITRSDGGSFIADGFESGEEIRVFGSEVNDGYYIIASVTVSTLTLHSEERLNQESAGKSITIIAVTGSINMVIGGTAGSVVIGRGSTVYSVDDATYRVPMSVLVADSNGNPVSGALVSLSAWPAQYSSGVWYDRNPNGTVRNYNTYFTRTSLNEDINENTILDPGEDLNGDGELTPRNSAAGDVPTTVTTDANGVATFDLVYLKNSAAWIYNRIKASTKVLGTEITSSVEFRLPYITKEGEAGDLPDSPYPISLVTDTTTPVSVTFPQFGVDTIVNPDEFSPTDPLTAGDSNMVGHTYTFDPTGGTPAKVGDTILDWITAKGSSYDWSSTVNDDMTAYFQVRIAVKYGNAAGSVIVLNVNPSEITADGADTSIITASVTNSQGGAVADGTRVDFSTDLGNLSAAFALTVNGVATVTLTSGTVAGTSTVTANTMDGATDNTTVGFVAGPVSNVSVTATPDTIEADGISTSSIKATAKDVNGNPVADETITFTAVSGTLSPVTAKTDANGLTSVTYTSPNSPPAGGTDTITATSTNGTAGTKDIEIITVPVETVTVKAGTAAIVADGITGTIIRATVKDAEANNIPDGTTVSFTTTAGTLSAATATTVNGVASIMLTSSTIVGSATVTAACGGVLGNTTVTFISGPVGVISLSANPATIPADASSTSNIRAYVADVNGNTVADGVTIRFRVTTGMGTLSSSTATTVNGVATVTFTASAIPGIEVVTADAANGVNDTVNVTLQGAIVGSVNVAAGSDSITADGSSSTWISATVKDTKDNPVPDGTNVSFTTTSGSLSAASATTTNGVATVTLISSVNAGSATVTATVGGVNGKKTVNFVAGPVTGVAVTASPANLTADGTSTSTIQATVIDTNGNTVSGETIRFTAVSGTLSALTAITNTNGVATVTYTAPNAVPVGNTDTITARSSNNTIGTAAITLISTNVGSVSVASGSSWLFADGTSGTLITATVKDINGNNVTDGTLVSFTTSAGTLSPATATTVNGKAHVTLTSARLLGKARVVAVSGGVNATVDVNFIAGSINTLTVLVNPDNLTADGVSTSTIKGIARDSSNNPVEGETLTFTAVRGYLSSVTAITNANGEATVTYTVPDAVPAGGNDTVTATATNGISGADTIALIDAIVGDVQVVVGSDTLIADASSSTLVLATVTDINGNPVADGTTVSFSTTAGSLSGATATLNGMARATLTSAAALGTATVSVTCGGVNDFVTVNFIAGLVSSVKVLANPNNLTADGVSTSTIKATATDANNNPVLGETLTFNVVSGDLSAITAVTNTNGVATVTYTAPGAVPAVGTDTLTASSTNGKSGTETITLIDAVIGKVDVSAGSAGIVADGLSKTLISATVTDINGNAVADGTTVNFTTTAGDLSSGTAATINGVATVTLTSATALGTATVTATSGGVNDTVKVSFIAGPVDAVTVLATPDNLTADGVSISTIKGTAVDANNNPVAGETLTFNVVSGDLSAITVVTNTNGVATVTYTAPGSVPAVGTDTVTASSTNGKSGTETITLIDAVVGKVDVSAGSAGIVADGLSKTLISATVTDINGNAVADGTTVNFTTTAGDLSSGTAATINGVATVTLTSATVLGTATVTATSGGVNDTVKVSFIAGPVDVVTVLAIPDNLTADGVSTSTIKGTAVDANNNPVFGETLTFNVVSGDLSAITVVTNTNGVATVTYTAPGSVPAVGTDTVTVTSTNNKSGTDTITLIDAIVGSVDVSSASKSIIADGSSTTLIFATVKDINDNLVANGTEVNFSTSAGTLLAASAETTNGIVTVSLRSPTIVGTATVIATCGGVSGNTIVTFIHGPVKVITLTANPKILTGDGASTSIIRAMVTDINGNAIDGETISFSVSTGAGTVSAPTAETSGGVATVTYTASDTAGVDTITAESTNGTSETVNITLEPGKNGGVITVTASPETIPADGASTSVIAATLEYTNGTPIVGVPVTFSKTITSKPDDDTYEGTGSKVTTPFHTDGGNLTFTLNHDGASNFIVWLWEQNRGRISLLVNKIGKVEDFETVEALDQGDYFFEVYADGTWTIKIDGNISSIAETELATVITDALGHAAYTYTSSTIKGQYTIYAKSGELSDNVLITQTAGDPAQVEITVPDTTIYANGEEGIEIYAVVTDVNDNLVEDGTSVSFVATLGSIDATANTMNGTATARLTSNTSAVDVTSDVTATVNSHTDTAQVNFYGVSLDEISADPQTINANGTDISTITVQLMDEDGVAISGETIAFSTTSGSLSPGTAQTNQQGTATTQLLAPLAAGTAMVTANYGQIVATVNVTVVAPQVATVAVSARNGTLVADGVSSTRIEALVKDNQNNTVADGTTVNFSTTGGVITEVTTTANGVATAKLTSPVTVGTATVIATCGGVSGNTIVTFIHGPVEVITLTADPDNVTADGVSTSTIKATAKDANANPVSGETLNFIAKLGDLSAITAITNTNGIATVTYTAPVGSAGSPDTVTATSTNSKTGSDEITLVDASVGDIQLSAGKTQLIANGSASTIITARVWDLNGNAVADNTPVTFGTTAGTLSGETTTTNGVATAILTSSTTAGTVTVTGTCGNLNDTVNVEFIAGPVATVTVVADPDNVTADGVSTSGIKATATDANANPVSGETLTFSVSLGDLSWITAVTDANGVATVMYTAPVGSAGSPDTVTATSTNSKTGSDEITLVDASVGDIQLSAGKTQLIANGSASTIITARVWDLNGNAVADNTPVTFGTTAGTLSGETTTTNGVATAILTSSTTAGTVTVTGTCGNLNDTVNVEFIAGPVATVTVVADPDNVTADGVSTSGIKATATDANANPVSGETLTFSVSLGDLSWITAVTDANGVATVMYTAPVGSAGSPDTVTATSTNSKTGSDEITLVDASVGDIQLSAGKTQLIANGSASTIITARVWDLNGNAVADNTPVTFGTTAGTLSGETTTTNGVATAILTSSTTAGTVTVTGTCGNLNDTVNVEFIAGPVATVTVVADPDNVTADGVSTSAIKATATDANANPVSGETLTFSVSLGDLSWITAVTDANGVATVMYTAPVGSAGSPDTVTATSTNSKTGSDEITLVDASVGDIQLSAGKTQLIANGSASTIITARVWDLNGNAVADNTPVTFGTTAGTLSGETTTTNGVATAILTSSTTAGTVTVTGTCGNLNDTVNVEFIAGPVAKVTVVADPDNVTADGVSTSGIKATATDANANPVSGETLTFSVSLGDLSWITAVTDANGVATVMYTAPVGSAGSPDTVTATSTNSKTGSDEITLVDASVGDIQLSAGKTQLIANGSASTIITARVWDLNGNAVADNTPVTFGTTAGTLSGETTTTNGVATAILTSSTTAGTVTVTGTCGNLNDTVNVEFIAGPVATVTVVADPDNVTADGVSTSGIKATATDANANPVSGETLTFSVSLGDLSWITAVTDANGVATVMYTAPVGSAGSPDTVTATSTNSKTGSDEITLVDASVGDIQLSAGKTQLIANGSASTIITARVWDLNGNAVADNTPVTFGTTAGTLSGETTTTNGVATAILTSSTTAGTVTVTGTCGNLNDTVNVEFIAGPVATVTVVADPDNVTADGVSTSAIKATATDANANPVSGETLTFSVSLGDLSWITAVTDANGVATVMYTAPVGSAGSPDTVTATSTNSKTGSDEITLVDASVGDIQLSAGKTQLIANGSASTIITARVWDLNGNAVADNTPVTFGTTAGTLSGETTTTNGVATAILTSSTTAGTVTVTGTCGNLNDTVNVEFIAGPVATVTVVADPDNVTADGVSTSGIKATATDANANPVSGETLTFSVSLGDLSWITAVTDANGVATVMYTAPVGSAGSPDTVTATSTNSKTGSDEITLVDASVGDIQLSAGKTQLIANGSASTIITARVWDLNGNAVADNTPVTFGTTAGTLSEETTTTNGVATAILTSSTTAGTVTVTGTCGNLNDTVNVEFIAGPVATVAVVADPDNVTADGVSTSAIKATVTDANANPVSGETLNFSAELGDLSAITAITNANGVATVTYTAPVGSAGSPDTVTVLSTNAKSGTDTITLIAASVGSVTVTAGSSSLVADGSSTTIFATVKDVNGNNIADGTPVTFSTTAGTLSGGTPTTNGIARVTLTSGINPGTAVVTATVGGRSDTVSVVFVAGPASRVLVTADPSNLTADGTSTSRITVVVLDVNDNPVTNGTTVTFEVDYGALSSLNGVTTNGALSVTYTAPSAKPAGDQATVTARTVNGANGNAAIHLIGAQIATISLTANPESLPADGASTATISATLTVVGGGNPPDGTSVNFSIIRGGGGITSTATSANGVASATLTSGDVAGTATIQAEAGGRTAQIDVDYTPGSVTLAIVPNALLGTGEETATVTVQLKNADGTPAEDDQEVRFRLSDESLGDIPASALTAGGEGKAQVTFEAAAKGGTVTVTGTWTTGGIGGVDVSGTADIVIYPPPAFIQVADGYPNPTSVNVKGTGGQCTSQIVFEVKDAAGELVADGYRIDFSILSGPNGGEEISPVLTTTSGGKAGTILTSGFKSGPVSVKGTYFNDTNVTTTTGDIAIVSGPPVGEELGIHVQYINVSGLWKMGLRNGVTVNAGDIYGNAVPDNTAISFKTYNTGGLFDPGSDGTSGGFGNSDLISVASPSPLQGFVSITGEAINGGRTTHVTAMAVDPVSSNVVFAATDGGGVYKSTDAGVTWRNVSSSSTVPGQNWIDPYVNDVAIDPENNNTVYAATGYLGDGHVYRSLDGGSSWNSNNAEEYKGVFRSDSAVLTVICDDAGNYVWIGTQGNGVYYTTNGATTPRITWIQANGLGNGTSVKDLVKAPGTHGATAVLYAATATGVFRSTDGGATWTDISSFTGDNINTLALHPDSDGAADIIYAGTNDAGVYVSADTGTTWTPYTGGMGKGLSASTPVPGTQNTGTGVMSRVTVGNNALSEYWTITCKTAVAGKGVFSVVGTVSSGSQPQPDYDISAGAYTIADVMTFTITAGSTDFVVGDTFTFRTTRDPGREIKDLLVDEGNNRLYAVTYFWGAIEPHAVGNLYTVELNAATRLPSGDWAEAVDGLPAYDPPDDTTLFAQHALASNVPPYMSGAASALYIGGEGINLYKATSNLAAGDPQWQQSDSGLTNRIMARMPVLFSGVCTMKIAETPNGGDSYTYTVYIEDVNGNPPIEGTTFAVTTHDADGALIRQVMDLTYPDTRTYQGTWRDPSDASTNDPYIVDINFTGDVAEVKFLFTPTCEDTAPGCSGSNEEVSYIH